METKSYQVLLEFISAKLRKIDGVLPKGKIAEEIMNTRVLIDAIGSENFAILLSLSNFTVPGTDDLLKLSRELETHFDVKMDSGFLIQGEEQRERDTTWWTSISKQRSKNYYWNRLQKYLETSLPPDVIRTLDVDTDMVMNNLESPSVSDFSRYGMVVGHVQSGKTGNFSALICKAADSGYKFIVVISGDKNILRTQTQERLNETFVGQTEGIQVGAGKGNASKELLPISLTTIERDFNKRDADKSAQGLNFDNVSVPILIVIKKNTSTLNSVIEWLQKQYRNNVIDHAMLVVDDESDYASINTKDNEDPTAINRKLRTLISLFHKSAYVAYTATPYANIFIDHEVETAAYGRDLFPKDFIYALDAPSNYFGARRFFLDPKRSNLVKISDWAEVLPLKHKSDFEVVSLPESMLDAIRAFTLVISIRHLRGQDEKHNSMLIHATRFTDVHIRLSKRVEDYLTSIKEAVTVYGKLPNAVAQNALLQDLQKTFDTHYKYIELSFHQVLGKLAEIAETIVVREVHQKTSVPLEYRKDTPTNAIVIGGTSLSRGFTLVDLSVSYFLRSTIFYDTLMQMARWFGYRPGFEDLCRVFMPKTRMDDFAEVISSTEELFDDFKVMSEAKMTPSDFGLAVRENPNSFLQVTARNKLKNVKVLNHSMQLDGRLKETSYLLWTKTDIKHNVDAIKKLIMKLGTPEEVEKSLIWRQIDKGRILEFLGTYRTYGNDRLGLTSRMPIAFIEKYALERNTDWDISLHSGEGDEFHIGAHKVKKQKRRFNRHSGHLELQNRQVSSGSAEAIGIEDPELRKSVANSRGKTRILLSRPLLMLHILEESDAKEEANTVNDLNIPIKEIAAFGVSFPGNAAKKGESITLRINTVYYQNILKDIEQNEGFDD
ncbi:Z1 domain-containing protein [Dyadobacter arcticus]|uniref:Putative endonuclease Z1 domain-containing protein n=1 Tax=Dyadobacter arcticus TaxID=1078754 RepID=A0ABX0UH17_9BACT|nr:Z1 domain-containing protein [Dyadobacter arcticus]NIJ52308.1 hypothetical protein [Dyadobacter arcticus]